MATGSDGVQFIMEGFDHASGFNSLTHLLSFSSCPK